MASDSRFYLYWDACVFNSYAGQHPDRVELIAQLWEQVSKDPRTKIITSSISIAEVIFASGHGPGRRIPERELMIDAMWTDPSVEVVDATQFLMYKARDLVRVVRSEGFSLQPNDALHLVTAQWVNANIGPVREIHTYDPKWEKFSVMVDEIRIREPYVLQERLIPDEPPLR